MSKFWATAGLIVELLFITVATLNFFTERYAQAACFLLLLVLQRQERGRIEREAAIR